MGQNINGETTVGDIAEKYKIDRSTVSRWAHALNLPTKKPRNILLKVPENFKEVYMKYVTGEISRAELLDTFEVSMGSICKWRDELNLPLRNTRSINIEVETPDISKRQEIKSEDTPEHKSKEKTWHIFKITLFNYSLSVQINRSAE